MDPWVSLRALYAVSPEEPTAPAQVPAAAPSLSFAAQLEGKMEAMASDPDSVQPTIVASMQMTAPIPVLTRPALAMHAPSAMTYRLFWRLATTLLAC
jgi:hypothetical protein